MTARDARPPAVRPLHHPFVGLGLLALLAAAAAWLALAGPDDQALTGWLMLAAAAGFATSGST